MSVPEIAKDQFVDGGNPGVGKAIVLGAVAGIVITFVAVGAAVLVAGYGWTAALGLGLFASIWSGLGFGFMFSGIVYVTRLETLHEAEQVAARTAAPAPAAAAATDEAPMARPSPGSTTLA